MKYDNLRKMTVFDVTDDQKILHQVLPYVPKGIDKKESYNDFYSNPTNLALALLEIAQLTGNSLLETETKKQFENELQFYFNE